MSLFVFLLWAYEGHSTHIQGVEIYYQCLNSSTKLYRIYIKVYRDCSGISVSPPDVEFNPTWYPTSCNAPIAQGPWTPVPLYDVCAGQWDTTNNLVVLPGTVCDNVLCTETECNNGNGASGINGTDYRIWYRDYSFANANCSNYTLVISSCCRNTALVNLSSTSFCNAISLDPNLCNSAPAIGSEATPYLCVGQTTTFNPNVSDPDGDSLVFSLSDCYADDNGSGGCNWNSYTGGFSVTNPLPSNPPISIDSTTGAFTVTPTVSGMYQFCYKIEEYKNGTLVGTYIRDMQVVVIDCPPNKGPVLTLFDNNGQQLIPDNNNVFYDTVCVGALAEYLIDVKDNEGDQVKITYDNGIPGNFPTPLPTNFVPQISGLSFQWTPPGTPTPNPLSGVFIVEDDGCPISGKSYYTLRLYVVPEVQATINYNVNCNTATISANISGGFPPYSIQWSGSGGINNNPDNTQMSFTHTFPGPGKYPIELHIEHGANCPVVIYDTITVPNTAVIIDAGTDRTICSSITDTLGSTDIPGQTYAWTPTTGLSDPTIARPVINITTNNVSVPDTFKYYLSASNQNGCSATDSITIVVFPKPIVYVSGKNEICAGESDTLSGPDYALGYSYQWSTGDTSRSILVQPSKTTTYTLYTTNGVCVSSPFNFTVIVQDTPQVQIIGPNTICKGNQLKLVGIGADQIHWSDGSIGYVLNDNPIQDTVVYWAYGQNGKCVGDTVFHTVITVPAPVLDIDTLRPIEQCLKGNSFSFSATPLSVGSQPDNYIWILGEGAMPGVIEGQSSVSYYYLTPGQKQVKVYAKTGDCPSDTTKIDVIVNPQPEVDFVVPTPQCFFGNSYSFTNTTIPLQGSQFLWVFQNATPDSSTDVHPSGIVFDTSGVFNVTLYAETDKGCKEHKTKRVTVYETPADPEAKTDTACYGFTALLYGTFPPNVTFYWYTSQTSSVPVFIGNPFTTPPIVSNTTYWVEAVTKDGCPSRNRIPVKVIVEDIPDVTILPDSIVTVLIPNAIVEFSSITSPDVEYWLWNFGNGQTSGEPNPTIQYFAPGTYTVTLTVTDSAGCTNAAIARNLVIVEEPLHVFAPNAFSPNGDGLNDYFEIKTQLVRRLQITIYDRFGNVIYESNDINFKWDGTVNGSPAPEGAYVYTIKGEFYNGKPFEKKGSITIIR